MRPVTFDGCYGALHLPAGGRATTAVVLCSPFGYDALCVHRGWRELAERLAAEGGMSVLRFDYPGAGDSEGYEEDPERLRAWVESIKAATRYVRACTGATRLILCGLRLGALLAVVAAEELGHVDSVVLMSPVIAGKRYIRELRMQHESWLKTPNGQSTAQADGDAQSVGAFGFQLHADALEELAEVDLVRRERVPARRVLVQDVCSSAASRHLVEHYRERGASADLQIFPEFDKFQVDPRSSVTPQRAFDSVLEWLGHQPCVQRGFEPELLPPAVDTRIDFAGGHEEPVVFGEGQYAGIFCRPHRPKSHAPAVLIVNTGGVHRVGDARLAVLMARRLAAQGIASLRMDMRGMGDSRQRGAATTLEDIYARHAVPDALAGVDRLTAAGYERVVTFGVCSGGYVSIHAALAHPRVVGCMSVNLPFFFWNGPQTKPSSRRIESSRVYWRSVRSPRKWLRLLTWRSNGTAIALELARRWFVRLTSVASSSVDGIFGLNPSTGAIRRLLTELDHKGVQTSLVYGSIDVGLDELESRFGRHGSALHTLTNVDVKVHENVDHSLFSRGARETVVALFEDYMRGRVLGAGQVQPTWIQARCAGRRYEMVRADLSRYDKA
ncbi:alpha/beta fold hydrolase [Paraburkholderia sacchari]|uniref:alpha/beta fold hydrolase n=1 Tax=Paraburkholderia sacchari TaxID=159450 RepID=UPI001FD31536|nr:alpha/beta fold hydrolase [Paraburkholderia sacchari]